MNFLYVEDHAASRHIMRVVVERFLGHSLALLDDSQRVIAEVEAIGVDFAVVLLDLRLKPDDGFTVQTKLKNHGSCRNAKFVAVTANILPGEVRRLQEQGFAGLLSKPIDLDTFPALVQKVLAGEPVWDIE